MEADSPELLVTQCPHCDTRFRVTEQQLQLASGRVRCGACLSVFEGVDHLVWAESGEFQSEEEAQQALDGLLNELQVTSELPDGVVEAQRVLPDEEDANPLVQPGLDPETKLAQASHALVQADDDPGDLAARDSNQNEETAEALQEVAAADDEARWLREALEDEPAESPGTQLAGSGAASVQVFDLESTAGVAKNAGSDGDSSGEADARAMPEADLPRALGYPAEPPGAAPSEQQAAVADGYDEPERRWWVSVVLGVAAITLVAQILWYQFDSWSVNPTTRPLYSVLCKVVGCELPVMRDADAFVATELMVRSHPDVAEALLVNAVIVNRAEFSQPFPVLELKFAALQGRVVAGRQFRPEEYLAGELSGAVVLERNVPVHVELAIADPGTEAVNYYLTFR